MANVITSCRIICSITMLFFPAFSPWFYILYVICGFTDMTDGAVARKTNTVSEFGSKFDTVADFIFLAVCLIKLLPVSSIPAWLWIWFSLIAVIKIINMVSGFILQKKLVAAHTLMNKVTGILLFLLPLTLHFLELQYSAFPVCVTATFAESAVLLPSHTFDGCNFSSLDCFDQFEIIEHDAFANNAALTDITMKSVKYIAKSAFENCVNLTSADFPYAAEVDQEAFQGCASLTNLTLSDNVDLISYDAFNGCENLKYLLVNGPVLLYVDAFSGSSIERLEMNGLVTAHSLPIVENSIIALPSTFAECTEDTTGRNYRIYGTKGTYAESWAKENGHEFIEISQETAILKDIPTEYASGEVLSPDVIGFNRTYQWYGNTTADNTSGTPIDGATDKTFNPADYPASPYYYCVVTSTDEGYEPLEIRTGVTQNTIACEEKPDHNQPSGGHHIKDIFNSILNFLKAVFRWICSLF